jgi:predicted PurR-regulated permease PerM
MTTERKWWLAALACGAAALLYLLGPILVPFLVGALLAWLGNPVVERLQIWRFPRSAAVAAVFVGMMLILPLLVLLIVPMVVREFAALTVRAPQAIVWFQTTVVPWLVAHLDVDPERLRLQNLETLVTDNFQSAGQLVGSTLATVSRSGHAVFLFFINLLLIPVVTFYLLRDWSSFVARMHKLLPRDQAPLIERLAKEFDDVLAAFFRGQFLVMLTMAGIYSFGLSLVGLDNAAAVGVIAGLLGFVPYLGIATGITLALLSATLQGGDGWLPMWVLLVFAIGYSLESMVLTPRLVGGRIGLHPVVVIFAILAGGELFGFVGVLLALPGAAAITVLLRHALATYLRSDLYRGDDGAEP